MLHWLALARAVVGNSCWHVDLMWLPASVQALKGKLMDQLTKLEEGAALRRHVPVNDLEAAVSCMLELKPGERWWRKGLHNSGCQGAHLCVRGVYYCSKTLLYNAVAAFHCPSFLSLPSPLTPQALDILQQAEA